ncbi:MAG TPA: hypothetical protein VLD13_05465, partial [Gaiellaceae bacterium]|nr:hypothetical protein [Gaiellaceae bacterium]
MAAVWAFGGFAAKRERNSADQELVRQLNASTSAYARLARHERENGYRLARSEPVARAFAANNRRALRAIGRANPWIVFRRRAASLPGEELARFDVVG